MALNEILCTTGGSTCHVLPQSIESLRLGITPFGKTQASQSCKLLLFKAFRLLCGLLMIVEEFGNSVEPILEKLCEYESFDEATPLPPSTSWDLLRSQPGVAARVSPHEAWDFLRTVLAADPEDAEMEGFFGC